MEPVNVSQALVSVLLHAASARLLAAAYDAADANPVQHPSFKVGCVRTLSGKG